MIVEKLIRTLKKDPNYKWNSKYSLGDLSVIMYDRSLQAMRGFFLKLRLKSSRGIIFKGSKVKCRHHRKISVGKNLIIGDYTLINALSTDGIKIGDNVSLGRNTNIICTGVIAHIGKGLVIGDNTGINDGGFLGCQGGIVIGNNVIIGPGVKIFSENHVFSDLEKIIKDQGVSRQGVTIGDNCWIGANVTILDGTVIGSGCVVAAGAVVNKSFPENSIIGGVPAKLIKERK